jgi:hypothetical protein
MSNDRDQEIVTSALTDTSSGLLEFLPALGQREALAFGDGVALPVRIIFDELPADRLPRSTTAHFTEHWQRSVGDEGFLEQVVEKWRASDIGIGGDLNLLAEGMDIEPLAQSYDVASDYAAGRAEPPAYTREREEPDRPAPSVRQPGFRPEANGTNSPRSEALPAADPGSTLKTLRDRLIQRQQR